VVPRRPSFRLGWERSSPFLTYANVAAFEATGLISFFQYDQWEELAGNRNVAFLGYERPSVWEPYNWVDDYPFLIVSGIAYYYP